MTINKSRLKYIPGTYAKKRPDAAQMAARYISEWSQKQLKMKGKKSVPPEMPPVICFSRKIGAGALEIADLLAEKIYYRIVDRELLDHMAKDKELSKKTVEFFEERYPGKIYCADHIDNWTQMLGNKSYYFKNPLNDLGIQIRALSACIPGVPVNGFLFFDHLSEFPRGHPEKVIHLNRIPQELRPDKHNKVEAGVMLAWEKLTLMADSAQGSR